MFDLEREVFDWRLEMSRHEAIGFEMLDELESHLLEEIDELRAGGMNDEQAFHRAVRTLGSGAAVQGEVAKVDPDSVARNRGRWILIGFLVGPLAFSGARLAISSLIIAYDYCLPESWRGESRSVLGLPFTGIHSLGILSLTILCYWFGLRWLGRRAGSRWLHRCASYSQRPLALVVGVVTLTLLCAAVSALRSYWFYSNSNPDAVRELVSMEFIPSALARLLLPLLCVGFLVRWRRNLEARSAIFWATSGWLLLSLCSSLFGVVQQGLVLAWVTYRPDSWTLSSQLGSGRLTYASWDGVLLFCPLAILLAVLVLKGGSGLMRGTQTLILWAIRHPILLGLGCLAGPFARFFSNMILTRSFGPESRGAMVQLKVHMSIGWLVMLPLMWGVALRRIQSNSPDKAWR